MDDISSAIRSVLNDPQSMAQIQSIMQSLGGDGAAQNPPPAAPAPAPAQGGAGNALQSLLPALGGGSDSPMMSTRLLAALRPLLGEERRKKLDVASRILKLLHLLPLLRESGVLQNIL